MGIQKDRWQTDIRTDRKTEKTKHRNREAIKRGDDEWSHVQTERQRSTKQIVEKQLREERRTDTWTDRKHFCKYKQTNNKPQKNEKYNKQNKTKKTTNDNKNQTARRAKKLKHKKQTTKTNKKKQNKNKNKQNQPQTIIF